jgi:hypothetical protein
VIAAPNPSATFNWVSDASCTASNECTAVGEYNGASLVTPLAMRWNGSSWTSQSTPALAESAGFRDVSCAKSTECLAVGWIGKPSKPMAELWNGKEWKTQSVPLPAEATGGALESVSCSSVCFAVGYWLTKTGVNRTYSIQWSGTEWILRTPLNGSSGSNHLYGVSCSTFCFAVGEYADGLGNVLTLIERWNGTEWTIQSSENIEGQSVNALYDVSCTSNEACTAVGGFWNGAGTLQKTLAERWNGKSWKIQSTPNPAESKDAVLYGVSCVSLTICEAAGFNINGSKTTVSLAEVWSEGSWAIQTTPNPLSSTSTVFRGMVCVSSTFCFGVGNYSSPELSSATLVERYS